MSRYRVIRDSIQYRFAQSIAKIQFFGGGFGNGKTAGACVKGVRLALEYPGSNGLIARETYGKLNDTTRREFYKWLPASKVKRWPTQNDNTMILTNGSTINFRYIAQRGKKADDGQTTSNLLSATYDWIIVDQIEDPMIQYKDFLDLLGRLRGTTPYKGSDPRMPRTGPRFMILTSNPTGNWVYKKIVKPLLHYQATGVVTEDLLFDKKKNKPLVELFEGPTQGNAHNLPEDFIETQESVYTGQMYDRFVLGKWAAYEGLVYPQYDHSVHMIPHQHILDILQRDRFSRTLYTGVQGYDHGLTSPCCYLLGFTNEYGQIFYTDGFYIPGSQLTIDDVYTKIVTLQNLYSSYIDTDTDPIFADPSIFKQQVIMGKKMTTVGKMLRDQDLYIVGGQNDITSGLMKVSKYLSIQPNMHYADRTKPGPMMYFSDKLQFIDDEITDYFWDTNGRGDRVDKPIDRNDHALDVIKYSLSRLPEVTELVYRKPIITPEHKKWHEVN